jgi:hypothetical protein
MKRTKKMNLQDLCVVIVFCFWYVVYVSVAVGSALILSWGQTNG